MLRLIFIFGCIGALLCGCMGNRQTALNFPIISYSLPRTAVVASKTIAIEGLARIDRTHTGTAQLREQIGNGSGDAEDLTARVNALAQEIAWLCEKWLSVNFRRALTDNEDSEVDPEQRFQSKLIVGASVNISLHIERPVYDGTATSYGCDKPASLCLLSPTVSTGEWSARIEHSGRVFLDLPHQGGPPELPPLVHPSLAKLYQDRTNNLREALNTDYTRQEAAEILRTLIDATVLTPSGQDKGLEIDWRGDLSGTLQLASEGKKQPEINDKRLTHKQKLCPSEELQLRMVAGGEGNSGFFEPEIQTGTRNGNAGNPASAPITALTDRVHALERQLAALTGQVEENSFELRQLRSLVAALRDSDTETSDPVLPVEGGVLTEQGDAPATDTGQSAEPTESTVPPAADTSSAEPPLPDDAGESSYVRGYRMWRDGRYEEARTQLRETIENFPGHRFESYARNLLGRAYLDDNKPANATEIFVRNYQELPDGDRAADSLFFLGVALTELNYSDRACLAFDELRDVYAATLRSTIREQVPAARDSAGCN